MNGTILGTSVLSDNLYNLYSSSTSIAAFNILLLVEIDLVDCINIFVSFGRQCPPTPSLGSSISTFHLVFRVSRSSGAYAVCLTVKIHILCKCYLKISVCIFSYHCYFSDFYIRNRM